MLHLLTIFRKFKGTDIGTWIWLILNKNFALFFTLLFPDWLSLPEQWRDRKHCSSNQFYTEDTNKISFPLTNHKSRTAISIALENIPTLVWNHPLLVFLLDLIAMGILLVAVETWWREAKTSKGKGGEGERWKATLHTCRLAVLAGRLVAGFAWSSYSQLKLFTCPFRKAHLVWRCFMESPLSIESVVCHSTPFPVH